MNAIFADTSFYVACLSPRDAYNTDAVSLANRNATTILTTEFIIVELVNFFSRTPKRTAISSFIRSMRNDPDTIIVPASSDLIQQGFDLFSRRPDKEWSLTDCISFVVMEDRGIDEALTADRHFEQAGFKVLL